MLRQLFSVSLLLLVCGAPRFASAQNIAVYGAQSPTGDNLKLFNQSGTLLFDMPFQVSPGSSSSASNATIEDIAMDGAGNIYAVGKPSSSSNRAIFKSTAAKDQMNILFEKNTLYDSITDGSIAISPSGTIAAYGAQPPGGVGDNLRIFDQAGNVLSDMPFQLAPGSSSSGSNANIEDIAFDRQGNLYAVGKPQNDGNRAVFKSNAAKDEMLIQFEFGIYDSTVDGSISISPNGTIALYGAQNLLGQGSSIDTFDSTGHIQNDLVIETAPGSGTYDVNGTIEDITYDGAGNLYAVGKPSASANRTIFKSNFGNGSMDVLFQRNTIYDATIDGSIAIAVPEPAAAALVCLSLLCLWRRR